jgi:hypothetical protein
LFLECGGLPPLFAPGKGTLEAELQAPEHQSGDKLSRSRFTCGMMKSRPAISLLLCLIVGRNPVASNGS